MEHDLFDSKVGRDRKTWHVAAFSLEALILLFFLVLSVTVLVQLFNLAYLRGSDAAALTPAVTLASNEAEAFSANPSKGETVSYFVFSDGTISPVEGDGEDVYRVTRTTTSEKEKAGTMYRAVIEVTYRGETVYDLSTARYVSSKGVA